MRIAFTGASGTGKSTLATWVQETYGLEFNPVGSRSVAKSMGFDNPYDVDAAGKRAEFQERLLDDKIRWEREHEAFVTDRTTFDNLLYSSLHDIKAVTEEQIDKAIEGFNRYDIVFYCPVGAFCDIAGDPHRVASMAYHRVYDAALDGFLMRFGRFNPQYPYPVCLDVPELEKRKGFIREWVAVLSRPHTPI